MARKRYDYLTFRDCCEEFLRSTSWHGLNRIGWAWRVAWRFFWALWFLLCLTIFSVTLAYMIDLYLSFPKTTRIKRHASFEQFPAVTVCNINPLRRTQVPNTVVEDYRKFILDADWDVNITKEHSLKRQDPYVGERATFVKTNSKKTFKERTDTGHTIDGLILHCAYDGRECDVKKDFTSVWNDVYGNCYTFSGGKPREAGYTARLKNITGAGPQYGLNLVLNTEPNEHLRSLTESKGIRVSVHPSGDMPFPDEQGISVPANMEANINVAVEKYKYLNAPAGRCTNKGFNRFDYSYSQLACQKICKQEKIYEHCLCVSPSLPVDEDKSICSLNDIYSKEYSCYEGVMVGFADGTHKCGCEVPCLETQYPTEYTLNKWPARTVTKYQTYMDDVNTDRCHQLAVNEMCRCQSDTIPHDLPDTIGSCSQNANATACAKDVLDKFTNKTLKCGKIPLPSYADILDQVFYPLGGRNITYTKSDLVSVKVFVRNLGRADYEEESTYTLTDFLTQIGGISSLWIGISLISVVELGELLLTMVMIPCYNFRPWPEEHSYWAQAEGPGFVRQLEAPAEPPKKSDRPVTSKSIRLEDDSVVNRRKLPKRHDDADEERKVIESH